MSISNIRSRISKILKEEESASKFVAYFSDNGDIANIVSITIYGKSESKAHAAEDKINNQRNDHRAYATEMTDGNYILITFDYKAQSDIEEAVWICVGDTSELAISKAKEMSKNGDIMGLEDEDLIEDIYSHEATVRVLAQR